MKITKEQGEACLRDLRRSRNYYEKHSIVALSKIGWCELDEPSPFFESKDHARTALALCAAIAGVKP